MDWPQWPRKCFSRISSKANQHSPYSKIAVNLKICEELFTALFPNDTAKTLQDSTNLVLIPDDAVFVLPFELYSAGASRGEFPLLKKATTYYPSAVSLHLARTAKLSSHWQESFLGIADPISSPSDERFELVKLQNVSEKKTSRAESGSSQRAQGIVAPDSEKLQSRGFSFERLPGTAVEVQSIASLLKEREETVDVRIGVDATKSKLSSIPIFQSSDTECSAWTPVFRNLPWSFPRMAGSPPTCFCPCPRSLA